MKASHLFVSAILTVAASTLVSADRRTITVVGCLQEGTSHNDYILTHLNEPPVPTETPRTQPNAVERDDLQEARNAYRLKGNKQLHLDQFLGQQVRVSGAVIASTEVPASSSVATNSATPSKITESELAAIDVKSVMKVRNACGSGKESVK